MLINEFDLDLDKQVKSMDEFGNIVYRFGEFLQETPKNEISFYWKQVRIIVVRDYVENIVLLMKRGKKGEHQVARNFTIVIK